MFIFYEWLLIWSTITFTQQFLPTLLIRSQKRGISLKALWPTRSKWGHCSLIILIQFNYIVYLMIKFWIKSWPDREVGESQVMITELSKLINMNQFSNKDDHFLLTSQSYAATATHSRHIDRTYRFHLQVMYSVLTFY